MLRFAAYVAIGFVVSVAASLALLSLSPNYNDCVAHNGQHATGHYDANNKPEIEPAIARPTTVNLFFYCGGYFATENGDGITAVSTALLTAITIMLAFLAFDQGRTTRAQLRAYLYPEVQMVDFAVPGGTTFAVTVRNGGATPARDVEVQTSGFLAALPLQNHKIIEPIEDQTIGKHSKLAIFPNLPHHCTFGMLDTPEDKITPPIAVELVKANPPIAIYVAGEVRYRDVFNEKHSTQFCLFVDPKDAAALVLAATNNGPSPKEIRFVASHSGNGFT